MFLQNVPRMSAKINVLSHEGSEGHEVERMVNKDELLLSSSALTGSVCCSQFLSGLPDRHLHVRSKWFEDAFPPCMIERENRTKQQLEPPPTVRT